MLFNSLEFLVFFPVVAILYFLVQHRYRWALLLVASYYFYMAWKPAYILLIVLSTVIDYLCSRAMGRESEQARRKPFLYLSLFSNLGMLFVFKYFNFACQAGADIAQWFGLAYTPLAWELILPMGISFYTFQTMSYSIDVYQGKLKPELHFGKFALFVTFFPQLVAGPIERATHLLPQFHQRFSFDLDRVREGVKQMAWGLFKKIVIADRVALLVNAVYSQPQQYDGGILILATLFFAFQIYCDFSGYSDIALGAAKVLGFDLMKNFDTPYFARSISEFWKRWHISLSTWFRDYVYIPLGGNRTVKWRWYYNLLITFVVSGVWHGANWTFLAWGALHGFYLVASVVLAPVRQAFNKFTRLDRNDGLMRAMDILMVFVLTNLAWVFFRAERITDAIYILAHFFDGKYGDLAHLGASVAGLVTGVTKLGEPVLTLAGLPLGMTLYEFVLALLSLFALLSLEWAYRYTGWSRMVMAAPTWVRWPVYYALLLSLIFFRHTGLTEFIYFQF